MELIARQGDVLVFRLDAIPETVEPAPNGTIREGESTGHHHSVAVADVEHYISTADAAEHYLRVVRTTTLAHQEHGAVTLEPGLYMARPKRTYTPEAIRYVVD